MGKIISVLENIALDNSDIKVFLVGESPVNWQAEFVKKWDLHLANSFQKTISFINPYMRHSESIDESYRNSTFYQLSKWELTAAEHADYIFVCIPEDSDVAINDILHLGIHAKSGKLLVMCNSNFWKKGIIDVICEHYNINQFEKFEDVISFLLNKVR